MAVEIGDRGGGSVGQAERRDVVADRGRDRLLVAEPDFAADLDAVVVFDEVHREQQVGGVGPLVVGVVVEAVADTGDRAVLRRVVDQGGVDVDDREIAVVGGVVVGERQALGTVELGAVVLADAEGRAAVRGAVVQDRLAEVIGSADDEDVVAVRFLLVGAGDVDVGGGGEARGVGRIDGVAQVVVGQPVLLHGLRVAGDIGAQVVGVVVVGLEVELAAVAEPPAVIVVPAHLIVAVGAVHRRVVGVGLDVVEAALVFAIGAGEDEGEGRRVADPAAGRGGVVAGAFHHQVRAVEAEPGADRAFQVKWPGMAVHGLVAAAETALGEGLGDVDGGAGRQVDGAAQALGLVVGQGGLVHDQAVDGAGGDGVVLHRPAASAEVGAARIGVQQRHAAEGGAGQVAVDAADVDEPALARVGGDGDAGDAAQGLGGVEVRILLDGLGRLDVDQVGGLELALAGHGLLARGGDHQASELIAVGGCGVGGRRGRRRGVRAPGHEHHG